MKFWVDCLLLAQWNKNLRMRFPGEFLVFQPDTKRAEFSLFLLFCGVFLAPPTLVTASHDKSCRKTLERLQAELVMRNFGSCPLQEPPFHEGGGPGRAHRRGPEKEICPQGWRPGPEGEVMLLPLSSVSSVCSQNLLHSSCLLLRIEPFASFIIQTWFVHWTLR